MTLMTFMSFSEKLSKESESFILTLVVGHDIVPRLSWQSFRRLCMRLLDVSYRSKTNKRKIFSTLYHPVPANRLLYARDEVPQTTARESLKTSLCKLYEEMYPTDTAVKGALELTKPGPTLGNGEIMQLPGRVLHFTEESDNAGANKFTASWVEKGDMFDIPAISPRLVYDHFTDSYAAAVECVYKDYSSQTSSQ